MSGAMGSHQSHRAKTTTWLTPLSIIEALGTFDLDPCAHPQWPTANRLICLPDDGLTASWHGRVWLNPPYGEEVWAWLAKLSEHGEGTALIFARTETAGFVREVWGKATAVYFLHGRLHFHHADGTRAKANAGAPSVLVAYGWKDAQALRKCSLPGTYLAIRNDFPLFNERSAAWKAAGMAEMKGLSYELAGARLLGTIPKPAKTGSTTSAHGQSGGNHRGPATHAASGQTEAPF